VVRKLSSRTADDPAETAKRLGPLIRAEAVHAEEEANLTPKVVDALRGSGLFGLLIPAEWGGGHADLWTAVEVIEELSRADPSTGWCYMANVMTSAALVTRVGEIAARAMFGGECIGVVAGMIGPNGTGHPVNGGWIVNGTFSFASGSAYADYVTGGVAVETCEGPEVLAYVVPRSQAECRGNWNVQGLVATGSHDWAVRSQFVPEDYTFWNDEAKRRDVVGTFVHPRQACLYLDRYAQATAGHLGVALGTAKRALEEITVIADSGKKRRNAPPIKDQQLFQHQFVLADAKLRSARAHAKDAVVSAEAGLSSGRPSTELETHRIYQASCWGVLCAVEVVQFAYYWSGSQGLRASHPLGRITRDMMLGENQHIVVDTTMFTSSFPGVLASHRLGSSRRHDDEEIDLATTRRR
jgi:alkylation response protein AidB-like acyl-CoA dehydrogenase